MKTQIIIISVIVLVLALAFLFFIPVTESFISDKEIYGDYFCDTYDGSCVSTEGHYTQKRLSLIQSFYYNQKGDQKCPQ